MTEKIEDFPCLRYVNGNLVQSCKKIVDGLEKGKENINFPIIGHYLTSFTNMLPYFIQKKLWFCYPNLIMGEKI